MAKATDGTTCANSLSGEHEAYVIEFLPTRRHNTHAVTIACALCGAIRLEDFSIYAYWPDRDDDGDATWEPSVRIEFVNRTGRDVLATYNGVQYQFTGTLDVSAPVKIVRDEAPKRG